MQATTVIFLTLCVLKQNYAGENFKPEMSVYEALHTSSKIIKIKDNSSDLSNKADGNNKDTYYELRAAEIESLKNGSKENDPYRNFNVNISLGELIQKYKHIDDVMYDAEVSVAGRVHAIKQLNENHIQYYVRSDGFEIQVTSIPSMYTSRKEFEAVKKTIKRGDIIGCVGHPAGKNSVTGQMVVTATSVTLVSPCLHELPHPGPSFENQEIRFTKRYLDLILNDKSRQIFYTRARIIAYIRQYLDSLGFLEVETPILNMVPGGATAEPFATHLDEMDLDLYLRISPELYHKMLLVGGLNRIYEIGRQFRNERVDTTHNPEFTSCEFYIAYADYNDLINMTETMLSGMVESIHGSTKIKYHPDGPGGEELEIDFTPPFARVSIMEYLEQALNVTLPPADQLETPEANAFLSALCEQHKIKVSPPRTSARLFDKLVWKFIQEKCIQPTFIMDYPDIMSPYAKAHRDVPGLTERFELYVSKKEVCNAYSELGDPAEQRRRWGQQARQRVAGDREVPPAWAAFGAALEHGLPPAAGWGGGVDRLAMLLTDSTNIKEVVLFPATKPEDTKNFGGGELPFESTLT